MFISHRTALLITGLSVGLLSGRAVSQSAIEGFDGGGSGNFTGNFSFEAAGGNPEGNAHMFLQSFFPSLRTGGVDEPLNSSFIGDYSSFAEVTLRVDVKVDSITSFFGAEIQRPLGVALIDRDVMGPSGPSGVFFELAALSSTAQPNWTELSVTINDPAAIALPTGWIGFGDEDPTTFAPVLPPGATFASVLASVDEIQITGAVPGFFFTNANFDFRLDNLAAIRIRPSLGGEICAGVTNSTGLGADLRLTGSDVAAANALTLQIESLPMNSMGYAIHSEGTGVVQNPGGSQGNLCIAGATIGRFATQVQSSGVTGTVTFTPDLTMLPTPVGSEPALAGETRYFQYWYRDSVGGAPTSNFSSAEGVTFL